MDSGDVVHTPGPHDGSLCAKDFKKDPTDEGSTNVNKIKASEKVLPTVDLAFSVSSDLSNSTSSFKTYCTDPSQKQQPPLNPEEKGLDQLLHDPDSSMNQQVYLPSGVLPRGDFYLVPAQLHVNGPDSSERETDILDDELPKGQVMNSLYNRSTLCSFEGQATPAMHFFQPEMVVNGKVGEVVVHPLCSSTSLQECISEYVSCNGAEFCSQSFGTEHSPIPKALPQAPTRTTSSRDAVQRGMSLWQHVQEEFATAASHHEIEQSIEALNMLMLDLDPTKAPMQKSYSAPLILTERGMVITQRSFTHSDNRPPFQGDTILHAYHEQGSYPARCSGSPKESPATYSSQRPNTSYPAEPNYYLGSMPLQLRPLNTYSVTSSTCSPEPQESFSYTSTKHSYNSPPSAVPKLNTVMEPEVENYSLEGLVAHRVAEYNARIQGLTQSVFILPSDRYRSYHFSEGQTQARSPNEGPTLNEGTTSEGQYLPEADRQGLHSPVCCIIPELENTIFLNPGGQCKEKTIHSYRDAFDEMESTQLSPTARAGGEAPNQSFPVSPQASYFNLCRSPPDLVRTPLSTLKPHNSVDVMTDRSSTDRCSYVESVVHNATIKRGSDRTFCLKDGASPVDQNYRGFDHTYNYPLSSSSPLHSPQASGSSTPEGDMVNLKSAHPLLGSPGKLRRSVATNTPPCPEVQQPVANAREMGERSQLFLNHGSPVFEQHITTCGYNTPSTCRDRDMSRQSSSTGHHPPSLASYPVLPAPQFQLPEKQQSNSVLSYGTICSPVSSSCSTPLASFSQTIPDFSIHDGIHETRLNVKFVQDTSKFWYKPDISREQALQMDLNRHVALKCSEHDITSISLLKDCEPGAFIIRDSHSFRGAYGLAMKVASPPPSVQQNNKEGDITNELVRHFLIETSPKGVRLKGCLNEPNFGCLSALVYQHFITPLALPCTLVLPTRDLTEDNPDIVKPKNTATDLLKHMAVWNVLYINSVDMESLTGPQAIDKAISKTLAANPPPTAIDVHLKVSIEGITLTDKQRKLFFRRHYPFNSVIFCDTDPLDRKWNKAEGGSAKFFGIVARKQGSPSDNISHLFAELDINQPVSAIINFVSRLMIGLQKQ